jgi:holo-[acyl-carrier protein] synthase
VIVGIGLDVVDLARFQGVLERHGESFVRRVFREGEARPSAGSARVAHLGGLFAAKEAAMKALGTGWALGVGFRQIEIGRDEAGAPSVRFHGPAARRAEALGVGRCHLSITHDGRIAAAVAVLERSAP